MAAAAQLQPLDISKHSFSLPELDLSHAFEDAPPPRSVVGEIANQAKAGLVAELPRMVGQAAQYASEPGRPVYEWGKGVADEARARGEAPEYQPQPDQHNAVTNALAGGARMLAPSIVPAAAAGAALAASPVALPAAGALGLSAALGAVPAAMSQGQQTLDKAKEAGVPDEVAIPAARKTALVEGLGETAGTYLGGKMLGVAGRAVGKALGPAAGEAAEAGVIKPFLKELPKTAAGEVATEMGQAAAQAEIERRAGIDNQAPWDAAKETIAPTLGMTALLAPFGLAGHALNGTRPAQAAPRVGAAAAAQDLPPLDLQAHTFEASPGASTEVPAAQGTSEAAPESDATPPTLDTNQAFSPVAEGAPEPSAPVAAPAIKPSEAMGLNPADGVLSRSAAAHVDAEHQRAIDALQSEAAVAEPQPAAPLESAIEPAGIAPGPVDVQAQALAQPDQAMDDMEAQAAQAARRARVDTALGAATRKGLAWGRFSDATGTLGVPRAEMPQIKAEHRGAMVNFLKARGVDATQQEMSADELKPTQAEFSSAKVKAALGFGGADRSILTSSDGYVLDGHHQWLAKLASDEPVKVIRLNAPIAELLPLAKAFPSSTTAKGTPTVAQAVPPAQAAPGETTPASSLDDFVGQMPKGRQSMVKGFLNAPVTNGTRTLTRAGLVHEQIADGARVESLGTESALVLPDGRQIGQQVLGKVGMEYARHLAAAAQATQQEATQPILSTPNLTEQSHALEATETQQAEAQRPQAGPEAELNSRPTPAAPAALSPAESAGRARNVRRVEQIAKGMTRKWAAAPKITVVHDLSDPRVPEDVRAMDQAQRSGGSASSPEGVYSSHGEVFLVAGQLPTTEDVARVVAHEVLGHHGLRQFFGKSLDTVLKQVVAMRPALVKAKIQEYGLNGIELRDQMAAAEEVLADMAQAQPQVGFVRRAVAAIRTWLRENVAGFRGMGLSDDEIIRSFILPARGYVERGVASGAINGIPAFSREGEGFTPLTRAASTFDEARTAVKQFQGKPLLNNATGMTAVVSRGHLDKMLSAKAVTKSASIPAHVTAVANADELFERAVLMETHPDHKNTGAIKAMHRFYAPMLFGGKVYQVKLTVKEYARKEDGNGLYTVEAIDLEQKTEGAASGGLPELPQGGVGDAEQSPVAHQPEDSTSASVAGVADEGKPATDAHFSRAMTPEEAATFLEALTKMQAPPAMATVESVRAAVREVTGIAGKLPNKLGRVVVSNSREIKEQWQPMIGMQASLDGQGEQGKALAFYDPRTKTVFLIADHIKAGTEHAVVMHELMHKWGKEVVGKDGWYRIHGEIKNWENAPAGSAEADIYSIARNRVESSAGPGGPTQAYTTEELFPYAVQTAIEMGIKPNAMAREGTAAKWLAKVRKMLQDVWAKITGKPGTMTTQQMVDLAFVLARAENPDFRPGLADGGRSLRELDRRGSLIDPSKAAEGEGLTQAMFSRGAAASWIGDKLNTRPETIVGDNGRQYTAAQLQAMRNVGMQVQEPSLAERAKALYQDAGKKLAQGIVDQFAPVKDLDQKAYLLLRLSKGATGAFESFLRGGLLKLSNGVYDFDEKNKGGVVDRLLMPLGGEHHDFFRWVAANRAERLMAEGKENLFTAADIQALKTLGDGQTPFDYVVQNGMRKGQTTRNRAEVYRDSLATFNQFNKNILDMAEQSGLIDGSSRHVWENEFYVPFYRVADDVDGGVRGMNVKGGMLRQQAFKTLKGGKGALSADLLDNTLMNWAHLLDASAKNRAAKATLEAAARMGSAIEAPEDAVRDMGKSMGMKSGAVWFMDQGQKRHFLVEDPFLLTALNSLEYAGMKNPMMNAMGAFKHALTVGVTASPFFKIRNLIRDSVQVIGTSPIGYNPVANIAHGWKLTDPKSDAYFRLLAGGGTIHFGTMVEGSEAKRLQRLVESGVDQASVLDSEHKVRAFYRRYVAPGVEAYNELGNRGEAVNRAALYDQLIKQGVGHDEASLMARDLMDFSMQGSFTSIRFLTQVVPFFNARLQGLYKLGKAAKEDPARFGAVLGATAMVSLGLLAAYSDDDDWKKREDWDRNNYWWFKFGGTAFRIPKPFEIGAVATLAERGFELAFDKEMTGTRFRQQVMTLMGDQLSMNPVPQLVKPILDVYANKDSFSGRPIETLGMDKLKPEYRFTDRSTMAARAVSTAANAVTGLIGLDGPSPVQVDHMLQGYFGWLGSFVVGAADVVARPATGQNERATPDYWKALTGSMASDLRDAPSRYVSQMYTQAKELEEAYGTWQHLLKERKAAEAAEFRADHQEELRRYRKVETVKKMETRLSQQIRAVERSDMDSDAKREKIRSLREAQDRVARLLVPG